MAHHSKDLLTKKKPNSLKKSSHNPKASKHSKPIANQWLYRHHTPNYTHLAEFLPASLPIPTKDPGITQARSIAATTHGLTGLATLLRGIELELRTPLHSIPPELQIVNPPTTPSTLSLHPTTLFNQPQRLKFRNRGGTTWSEHHGEECVDHSTGNQDHRDEDQRGVMGRLWVILLATHLGFAGEE